VCKTTHADGGFASMHRTAIRSKCLRRISGNVDEKGFKIMKIDLSRRRIARG
jgi:hypothetical protein